MKTWALISVGLIATAGLVGCGGSSESSGSSKTLSQQQFVAKANAVCAQAKQLFSEIPEPEGSAEAANGISAAMPIFENLEEKLRLLQPPPEDASEFSDYLDYLHAAQVKLAAAASAAEAENGEQLEKIKGELGGSFSSKAKVETSNLGLTECETEVESEG